MADWDPFENRPDVLGERYRIVQPIGEGGAGAVYRAKDARTGRDVALKLVEAPTLSAPLRFLAEARDMARLRHPRVVRVLDAGRDGGWYWTVMELMRSSLKQQVDEGGPLAPAEALERVYEVLQGLHAVHSASIVHRDIKPHNVLLDDAGRARITDFGLARHEAGDVPYKTRTGESLGSPTYRAPEQGRNPAGAGREADIYGTGAVLYFAVTGKRPTFFYMMDDAEFAREVEGVPAPVAALIRKAMAHLPEERYRTAFEMAAAAAHAVDALPDRKGQPKVAQPWIAGFERIDEATPTGLWGRVRSWFGR